MSTRKIMQGFGNVEDNVLRFYSDGTLDGNPIRTRYQWSHADADHAHWEQASSSNGGNAWGTNWTMEFTRR